MHGSCFVRLTSLFHTCGLLNLQMRTVGVCLSDEMYVTQIQVNPSRFTDMESVIKTREVLVYFQVLLLYDFLF